MSLGCCGQLGTCLLLIPFLTFLVSLIGLPTEPVQFVRFVEIRSIQCILLENCAPGAYSSARMYVHIYILYKNHISPFFFPYQYLLIAFLVRPFQAKAGSSLWESQHFSSVFPGSPRCPCNFFMCFHAFSYNFHTRLVTSFNFPVHSWYILQI